MEETWWFKEQLRIVQHQIEMMMMFIILIWCWNIRRCFVNNHVSYMIYVTPNFCNWFIFQYFNTRSKWWSFDDDDHHHFDLVLKYRSYFFFCCFGWVLWRLPGSSPFLHRCRIPNLPWLETSNYFAISDDSFVVAH